MTTPEQLPPNRTPVDPNALATALWGAWRHLLGTEPSRGSLVLLVAHSALETGHWRSCVAYNLGNVKSREGDGRSWTYFRTSEVEHGVRVYYDPPSPVCRFRAFHTLDEGAADHLAFLARSTRYAKAWRAVIAADPHAYVRELKSAGYFTDGEPAYERSVSAMFDQMSRDLSFGPPQEIDDSTRARVLELVRLSSLESVEEFTNPPIVEPEPTPEVPSENDRPTLTSEPEEALVELSRASYASDEPPAEEPAPYVDPSPRASMRGKRRRS